METSPLSHLHLYCPLLASLFPGAVQRIFILEGMVIGVLSWIIANLLALPPGIIVGNIPGSVLIDAPPDPGFSLTGVILWS